ncbi:MAG TPA: class I fructose-bisphosphate aldolase [Polyangia bacterium]|jgi:fructose-bisphosphate aldolase class I|nr:class I fructose-bisphosphate aldolase [Polyangia bacterium]
MKPPTLEETARAIVAGGKGILAADETPRTLTQRLAAHGIASTADSRRDYREMLFTTPDAASFIGGAIMQDETIRQTSSTGTPMVELLTDNGIIPGIKVDEGARPMAGAPGERITEGLDSLRGRLDEYRQLGARFAKWRAVFSISSDGLPSPGCIHANADALARYAALCQEQGLVPTVEPEVLMTGSHTIERCEEVTSQVLQTVFDALFDQNVVLEGILLKPNMVIAGMDCPRQATVPEVAAATLRTLSRHVPPAVPAIAFLSGGQDDVLATEHLCVINKLAAPKPWVLSFSYGRALQDEALAIWKGKRENVAAAQRAFHHRARCDAAAALAKYTTAMETEPAHG